jgi:hypothetical protein
LPAKLTLASMIASVSQSGLLRICCASAGIRGRSTVERAVDLWWS